MYYIYGDIHKNCYSSHRSLERVFLDWIESQKLIFFICWKLVLVQLWNHHFYSHMVKEDTYKLVACTIC